VGNLYITLGFLLFLHRKEGLHTATESHPRFQSIGSKNKIFTQT